MIMSHLYNANSKTVKSHRTQKRLGVENTEKSQKQYTRKK